MTGSPFISADSTATRPALAGASGSAVCDQCTVAPAELLVSDLLHWSGFMRVCRRCQSVLSRDGETRTVRVLPNTGDVARGGKANPTQDNHE